MSVVGGVGDREEWIDPPKGGVDPLSQSLSPTSASRCDFDGRVKRGLLFCGPQRISNASGNQVHRCSKHTTFHEMCQWRSCYSKDNRQWEHSFQAVSRAWSRTNRIVIVVTKPINVHSNLPPPSDKQAIICCTDDGLSFDVSVSYYLLPCVHARSRSSPDNSQMLFHDSWCLFLMFVFP